MGPVGKFGHHNRKDLWQGKTVTERLSVDTCTTNADPRRKSRGKKVCGKMRNNPYPTASGMPNDEEPRGVSKKRKKKSPKTLDLVTRKGPLQVGTLCAECSKEKCNWFEEDEGKSLVNWDKKGGFGAWEPHEKAKGE